MVRRTKEEAQETRHKLLDAAEHLFQAQGVSRTTLQDIALRAGTTRGAIYWHFKDKADLFNAMMDRVTMPLEATFTQDDSPLPKGQETNCVALYRIRQCTLNALEQIVNDPQTRRVFEVATQKVEYVEELQAVRQRHLAVRNNCVSSIEQRMEAAAQHIGLRLPISPSVAAQGLHALIDGLIQNWLLDPAGFDLLKIGPSIMDAYLAGLGFQPEPQGPAATAKAVL
jgi:TetR/AcrR family acrAB operon transcriptional repressor